MEMEGIMDRVIIMAEERQITTTTVVTKTKPPKPIIIQQTHPSPAYPSRARQTTLYSLTLP